MRLVALLVKQYSFQNTANFCKRPAVRSVTCIKVKGKSSNKQLQERSLQTSANLIFRFSNKKRKKEILFILAIFTYFKVQKKQKNFDVQFKTTNTVNS